MRHARRGIGTALPLVVGLMGLLFLGGMVLLFRTGSSLTLGTHDAGGAVAENLATSAIEEALWHFQVEVNDPESELFDELRRALILGDRPSLDLTRWCRPERLEKLLATSSHGSFYRSLSIDSFGAVLRVPLRPEALAALSEDAAREAVLPGEQYLDVDCSVTLRLGEVEIFRRVAVRRRYGITFVSPYKPFDRITFAILDSDFLAEYPQVLRGMQRTLLQVQQVGSFLARLRAQLLLPRVRLGPAFLTLGRPPPRTGPAARALAEVRGELGSDDPILHALDEMEPDERGWAEWRLIAGRPETRIDRPRPQTTTTFEVPWVTVNPGAVQTDLPAARSVIYSAEPRVKLEDFDYDRQFAEQVESLLEDLSQAAEPYNQAVADLLGTSDTPLPAGSLRRLEAAALDLRDQVRDTVPGMVAALNGISRHINRHTTVGLTADVLSGYLSDASRRLRNLAFHAETAADIAQLRQDLPAFNGHLNYNGTAPLELEARDWKGMTVISGPWREDPVPVTVSTLTLDDPQRDLVTLNFDELHFSSGTVQAGVFVNDRAMFEGRPSIEGNLVLRRVRTRAERSPEEDLRGTVEADWRLASGEYWDRVADEGASDGRVPDEVSLGHYTVGLCPRSMQRAIFRSPGAAPEEPWIGDETP